MNPWEEFAIGGCVVIVVVILVWLIFTPWRTPDCCDRGDY